MKRTVRVLKYLGIAAGILVLMSVGYYVFSLLHQVTPEKADKASQEYLSDVKSKIEAVPGYKIVKQDKASATAIQDEMGSKDYSLSATFLVQKQPNGSAEDAVKADAESLAKQLATNDYGIIVENAPQTGDQPVLLCVFASRYLNNDGTYIPQGSTANIGRYITKDQFASGYVSGCKDIL